MVAFIQLTTPLLLAGLGLLALPIVAHLLARHSRRRVVFPSIALLTAAVASQSRFYRMRRLILLLLRLAAVACIVLAFTRPVWLDASLAAAGMNDKAAGVVILIDRSASTGQQDGGVALMERLRGAADRALDSLRPGVDVANLVYADAVPDASFPRLSPNLPGLRQELQQLQPTPERADFPAALELAGRLLGEHSGPRRLVIVSDLQASNWSEALADASTALLLPSGTVASVTPVAGDAPSNLGLSNPRHFPAQPLPGQDCELTIHVSSFSNSAAQPRVTLETGGPEGSDNVVDQTVSLAAGEARDVTFTVRMPESGPLLAEFSIPRDGLDTDNRAWLVVQSSGRMPVLVVSDDSPDEPGTAAFYMQRALMPRGDDSDRFDVRAIRPADLSPQTLAGVSAVFVGYVGNLPEDSARHLVEFIDGGGGVVWFCGEGPVARQLETLQSAAGDREILPWPPGVLQTADPRAEPLHITSGRWQSRWFREFDEQSQIAVAQIRFTQTWSTPAPFPETEVLLSFSNGRPALGSRLFGQGQLLVANFSPESASSDLGRHGTFVAWMQILASALTPNVVTARTSPPGVPCRFPQPFRPDQVTGTPNVLAPNGAPVLAIASPSGDAVHVEIPEPRQAGIYRLQDAAGALLAATAVNVDPRESDLRRLSPDDIARSLSGRGVAVEQQVAAGWEPILDLAGRPMWGEFLVVALVAIGLELFLLGLWRR